MSRLIDKLTHVRKAEPQPIGFIAVRAVIEKPRMQLVAFLKTENYEEVAEDLKPADAVVLEITVPDDAALLEKKCRDKDGAIYGGWLKTASAEIIDPLLKSNCDFMVFPTTAPFVVTSEEKIGRILAVDLSINETLLRTVNDLPVDAVLVSGPGPENGLTLDYLMQVQSLVYLVRKPVIVPVSDSITQDELQALWNTGVTGAAVEIKDKKTAGKLAALRKSIESLNPVEARKKARAGVLLPHLQPEAPAPQVGESGDDEEDE